MALSDSDYKAALLGLYKKAAANPMSPEDYAAEFAQITNTNTKTAIVKPGITVSTTGTSAAQTGATTSAGEIV